MRDAFARQGYIVVPDVLNQQQLDELNQVYDQHILEREEMRRKGGTDKQIRFSIRGRDTPETTDRHGNTYVGRRFWSKAYRDLIDNETMLPIIEEILGDPSWGHAPAHMPSELRPLFRLDHDNIHYKPGRKPTDGPDKGRGGSTAARSVGISRVCMNSRQSDQVTGASGVLLAHTSRPMSRS